MLSFARPLWRGSPPRDREEGSGSTSLERAHQSMMESQIAGRGIRDERVLAAMRAVPRHEFVAETWRENAYEDRPLPIAHGQTISQPFIVAFMTELLGPRDTDRILEVGTGSGYQAAVLSQLVAAVYTIEIVKQLAECAAADLSRLGCRNVHVRHGDGYEGWAEAAPFDAVIVTCAPDHIPEPLQEQLKEGGRLVIPAGGRGAQTLYLLEKRGGRMEEHSVLPVSFVPMTGEAERSGDSAA